MSFDLTNILRSKRAMRHHLATQPVAEKLRMLDSLRERALAIRGKPTGTPAAFVKSQHLSVCAQNDRDLLSWSNPSITD